MGHEVLHHDAFRFLLRSDFGRGMKLRKTSSLRKCRVNLYRRTPRYRFFQDIKFSPIGHPQPFCVVAIESPTDYLMALLLQVEVQSLAHAVVGVGQEQDAHRSRFRYRLQRVRCGSPQVLLKSLLELSNPRTLYSPVEEHRRY